MNSVVNLPTWLEKKKSEEAWTSLPTWAMDARKKHWQAFVSQGLPTRKDERWKYTDLSFLANKHFSEATRVDAHRLLDVINQHRLQRENSFLLVFVNGYFMPMLSDGDKLPKGVIACSLDKAMQEHADLVKAHWLPQGEISNYPFANLNTAMCRDGLFFYLPTSIHLSAPLHLLSLTLDTKAFIAHPHHVIVLGEESKLVLLEEYFSLADHTYMMNVMTHIVADKGAQLDHYKIQHEAKQAVHLAHTFVQQKQQSHVTFTNFSSGSSFARDEVIVRLQESGADCHTGGFYQLRDDNQYMDYHIDIEHEAPFCNSEMLFKGIVDKKSRAVFNGRLQVNKGAQKTMAYQANHNLLLSKEAEIYSKPELEIYADDVKCKHGASTGQIDEEAIFYLRSRGIDRDQAIAILLQGFADEILQRIAHTGIRARAEECLL
jgi:Fe-S cluster assembly protein SufD